MKVGYSETFPIGHNGHWQKIWIEDEVEGGSQEDVKKLLYSLKRQVNEFFYESNAAAKKENAIAEANSDPMGAGRNIYTDNLTPTQRIIDQINQSSDLTTLKTFEFFIKKNPNNPEFSEAYQKRLNELQKENV